MFPRPPESDSIITVTLPASRRRASTIASLPRRAGRSLPAVVVAGLAFALSWSRLPSTARDALWAEDGRNFLADSAASRVGSVWFEPFAGYLHLVPRVAADLITSTVGVERYALAVTTLSCAVVALVAAVVYICASDVLPDRTSRAALALTPALLPTASFEVLGNLANLHWFLLWATPWLLLHRPRTSWGVALSTAGLAVVALTEIQAVLFVPLIAWAWRDRVRWPARAALLVGLAVQAVVAVTSPRDEMAGVAASLPDLVTGYLVNTIGGIWSADATAVGRLAAGSWVVLLLAAAPFVAAACYVARRGGALHRVAGAALVLGSLGAYAGAYLANGYHRALYSSYTAADWQSFEFSRYGFVPGLLLVALLPLAFSIAVAHRTDRARIVAGVVLAAVLLVQAVQLGATRGPRAAGPAWSDGSTSVVDQCDDGAERAVAPIAPGGFWAIELPCSFVEAHD